MDKIIVTLLLIIGGIVCCMVVINAILPAVSQSTGAIADATTRIDDRIRCKISVIQMSDYGNDVYIWVKNIGASRIGAISSGDVFFGPEGNFTRIPYSESVTTKPYWNYSIESGTTWNPSGTVKITVYLDSAPSGSYYFKYVLPNGNSDEDIYSTGLEMRWKICLFQSFASLCL